MAIRWFNGQVVTPTYVWKTAIRNAFQETSNNIYYINITAAKNTKDSAKRPILIELAASEGDSDPPLIAYQFLTQFLDVNRQINLNVTPRFSTISLGIIFTTSGNNNLAIRTSQPGEFSITIGVDET